MSKFTFWWLIPFLAKGHEKGVKEDDLHDCVPQDRAETLGDELQREWQVELEKFKHGKEPSLGSAIVRLFGRGYTMAAVLPLIEECVLKILQALSLGVLVRCFTQGANFKDKYFGDYFTRQELSYISAAGVCLSTILCQFTRHPYFIHVRRIGMRVRIACSSLIARKALKLSQAALGETTVGQLVNLVSNDVGRFDQAVLYLPYLIIGPLQVALVMAVLWDDLNYSAPVSVSLLLVYIPYQGWIGKIFSKLRSKTAILTDERIRIMSEVVAGMKIIKMYTWERYFNVKIEESRRNEIDKIRQTSILQNLNVAFSLVFSKIILVICFVLYTVTLGGTLTADVCFVTMTLFNHLRLCMTFSFANAISQLAETRASIARLQAFMLLEEQEEMDTVDRPSHRPLLRDCRIKVDNISARWDCIAGDLTLDRISVEVGPGELLAVVGPVGSGKSSFLMTLLGELQATKGRLSVSGKVAYVSQEPWTFAGSVRQNILFGKAYDMVKYRRVLQACALDKDVANMARGDLTTVGERGVSLSGGQRARVNLARALYSDADIYLLDDPLSAVDPAVGKHLFDNCINGYLKHQIRVLVTHQVQFLRSAKQILVLENGKPEALGDFTSLVRTGIDLVSMSEDIVQERERRKSILASPVLNARRKSIVGQAIKSQLSLKPSDRRKSVVMTGRRKSMVRELDVKKAEEQTNGDNKQAALPRPSIPKERKKSIFVRLVSSESRRGSSFRKRDSVRSNVFAEDMMGVATAEISPFGVMYESNYQDMDEEEEDDGANKEESQTTGSVGWNVYWKYLRSGASSAYLVVFFAITLLTQFGVNGSDFWVTLWTNGNQCNLTHPSLESNDTKCSNQIMILSQWMVEWKVWYPDILRDGYVILVFIVLLLSMGRSLMFAVLSMKASVKLHDNMFQSVANSQIAFFDSNPVGRILNRFSRDIGGIDELLPMTFFDVFNILLSLMGSVILVIIVNFWMVIPTLVIACVLLYLRGYFASTTRDVKRIECLTRSPIFSCLATSLYGLTTIRAFGAQAKLEKEFYTALDKHTTCWFAFIAVSQAFGMVLDFVCCIFISIITILLTCFSEDIPGGNIGLAISSALVLSGTFQWGVRLSVEVENQMTSVERVLEYSNLKPECEHENDQTPPKDWPSNGKLDFNEVYFRYTPDGNTILKDFSCSIRPMEKVGIVGRTGAGKSSLIAALFRMVEPEGLITLDGLDIKAISLKNLRSNISIIPQEPLIFTASVRQNLDPFNQYSDQDVWSALEEVQLKQLIKNLPDALQTELTAEGGGNLSVGQRQLFCLARTILKHNKVLVMDEATASIDHKTDALIQKLIAENFRDCTILTIAHRLNTIIGYDKILVLDSGKAAEFDAPYVLLQRENGIFVEMVKQVGRAAEQNLRDCALVAFNRRNSHKHNLKNSILEEEVEPLQNATNGHTPTIVGSSYKTHFENQTKL